MRRLYSTFAGGWPGAGLLLMRLVAGAALIMRALVGSCAYPRTTGILLAVSAILAAFIISGLWTPMTGVAIALLEGWDFCFVAEDRALAALLGTIGGALAMLGPGVLSIDAHLFGWRRVELPLSAYPPKQEKNI